MGAYSFNGLPNKNLFLEIEGGNVQGWSHVRKFGKIFGLTTALTPITITGLYQTPTSAQSLEIVSSDTNDTAAGSGCREVTIIGLNDSFVETTVTCATDGTTPVAVTGTWRRVYRMYNSASGTYGTSATSSHAGNIILRNSGAGVNWAQLYVDSGFGLGQTMIGCYTVPAGYTAYVYSSYLSVDSTKSVSAYFFQRPNADDTTAPYSAIRAVTSVELIGGINYMGIDMPIGVYQAKTDIGWMAKTSASTANVSVVFDIYLKQN